MHKKTEKAASLTTLPRNRTSLALAVAIALGSPVLQAQSHTPSLLPAHGIEQMSNQLSGKDLVIIDGKVEDIASLLKAVPQGVEWIVLDSSRDGMVQLAEIASRHQNIRALHLLSHGEDGLLKLGNSELNQQTLINYSNELNALTASMAPGADLLLYGCEVAKTAKGKQFIKQLRAATGLDIAASNDVSRDGEWELEIVQGNINTRSLAPEGYSASLDIIAGDGSGGGASGSFIGTHGGNGGGDNDSITGTAYADVLFGDGSGGGASAWNDSASIQIFGGLGGSGNDILNGGAGDDILFGDGFDGGNAGGSYNGSAGGYGGGGGGGSYNGGVGGIGGLFAGNGGDATTVPGGDGGNGTGSTGGAGKTGAIYGYGYGGGGGGWSDGSGAGNGATADVSQYGITGVSGSDTPLTFVEDGGIGSYREAVKTKVDAGYFTGLLSGAGSDTLDGGPGSDDLFGLGGADVFQFEVTDAAAINNDTDTIHDFAVGTDRIHILNNGVLIDAAMRNALLITQTANPTAMDRTLVYTEGSDSVTIVVLGVGNDLLASDVPTNTLPTVNPSIDASVPVGGTFTVTENGFDADGYTLTYSYQWSADGVDIAGEEAATFIPTATESGALITVTVTADNGNGGISTPVTSAGVMVAAPGSGGGGAVSWLGGMMGLLLLAGRRLSNRRQQ